MYKLSFFWFFLVFNPFGKVEGNQVLSNDSLLKQMRFYSDSLRNSYNQQVRFSSNDSFKKLLNEFIERDSSFYINADSITTVKFLRSQDGKVRIITWLLADNIGNYQSYGVVQFKNKKGEVFNHWLKEKLESNMKEMENSDYSAEDWPGGLVYQIFPFKYKGATRYLLLSFHGLGRETNRKSIDVMTIDEKEVVFGLPVFQRYEKDVDPNYRVVFEFSDQTTMTLRMDEDSKNLIVFDHLVPASQMLRGDSQFLIPDGTYGCYVLQRKGKWLRIEDFGTYKKWDAE